MGKKCNRSDFDHGIVNERGQRRRARLVKAVQAHLKFAKEHLDDPEEKKRVK